MKKIVENTSKYLAMSKEENKEFLDNLYSLMKKLEADVVDYQGLKILSAPPLCPDCRSNHIIKNGLQNGMQNYRCKDCGRQFRVTTGTFVYRLQKKEKMLDYIRCMVAGKVSELVLKKLASVYQQALLGDTRYWQLYKVSKIISIFRGSRDGRTIDGLFRKRQNIQKCRRAEAS
ncbi:MAG: IS1 family transposase [Bacteroidales bacterium]|nr:IS1 family transposase [Bacteroidales bacterium]